jgi:hypothetical protein
MSRFKWCVVLAVLMALGAAWLAPSDLIPWSTFDPTVPVPPRQ